MNTDYTDRESYVATPFKIFFNKELSVSAIRVWQVIFSHYNWRDEECFPSLDTIIKESRKSKNTVLDARKKLREKGLMDWTVHKCRSGVLCYYTFPVEDLFPAEMLNRLGVR